MRVEGWPEADRLFRSDPSWCGGDDAYSVDLGGDLTLWLFGDSFCGERTLAGMTMNSVAVMDGRDPSSADIRFVFGEEGTFFVHPDRDTWVWPGGGRRVGDRLVLFFMHVRRGPHQFDIFGWDAAVVANPDDPPESWRWDWVHPGTNPMGAVLGAGVCADDEHLYAYGPSTHDLEGFVYGRSQDLHLRAYLARWPLDGDVAAPPEWFGDGGWGAGDPVGVFDDAHMEFSVHRAGDRWVQIQGRRLMDAGLAIRWGDRPEGPWGPLEVVHHPEESSRDDCCVYAFKAHPHLTGADLVVTYAVNTRVPEDVLGDLTVYRPRFLRVRRDAGEGGEPVG